MSDTVPRVPEDDVQPDTFEFWIDPGDASAEVVAEVLIALDQLYRSYGGPGFTFEVSDE